MEELIHFLYKTMDVAFIDLIWILCVSDLQQVKFLNLKILKTYQLLGLEVIIIICYFHLHYFYLGEALASISHVSHLTITSRTRDDPCAYKAKYQDGSLVGAKGETLSTSTSSSLIKPCAANIGTSIHVEDLFFNMQHRRKALNNFNEEYQRIQDVITKYAIHYGDKHIAFTCKKSNSSSPDFHSTNSSSTLLNIQIIYGASVCKELILFTNMIAPLLYRLILLYINQNNTRIAI